MSKTDVIIIGAGQAGLAVSHCLTCLGIDHLVLERGQVAERWRNERWDTLRLLTPNWMNRMPGHSYNGADPDGFMTAAEYAAFLQNYADSGAVPVRAQTEVQSVQRLGGGHRVATRNGIWHARGVVIATGHCDEPFVPAMAQRLPAAIQQVTTSTYRRAADLPQGGVLIIGASASGIQLAEEIHLTGRPVTIAVSRHTRLPRRYRGRDIMWWLDRYNILDAEPMTPEELDAARAQPSMQLVGRPDHSDLDLGVLQRLGIRLVGRVGDIDGARLSLHDNLADAVAGSHARMERLLRRVDVVAGATGAPEETMPAPFAVGASPSTLDLTAEGIRTVVWATGFVRNYRWLQVPVLTPSGDIIHAGGVTPSPGLFVTGLRFLRRRDASFIGALTQDATELSAEIHRYLNKTTSIAA
ncbi:MAG: NAD(P)-binding domain-containing protein [Acetobacteraceae bacterium]